MRSAKMTPLIALLLFFIISACNAAELIPVRITLGSREAPVAPSPVYDGDRVLAPLSVLSYLGASHVTSSNGKTAQIVASDGTSGEVNTHQINGTLMVPMDKVLSIVGGESSYNKDNRTLNLLAHLRSVEVVDDVVKAKFSFPVSCSVHQWNDKVIVDVASAKVMTEARDIYAGSALVDRVRLGQYTDTSARMVIDLTKPANYKLASDAVDSNVTIKITPGSPRPSSGPKAQQGQPFTVRAIKVQPLSDREFNLVIETSNKGTVTSAYGVLPPQVVLTLNGAVLDDAANNPEGSHSLLSNIKCAQINKNTVRVEVNLARIMAYDLQVEDNAIIARIRMPINSGDSLSNKLIVIDPGHGGNQKGACFDTVYEKDLNLKISLELAAALRDLGARVILTRSDDKTLGLAERPEIAIRNGADIFVSIHCNSNGTRNSASGIETYYHMNQASPRALAFAVHAGVCNSTGMCDRQARSDSKLYSNGLAVLRGLADSNVAGILLECGYLNHSGDRAKLLDPGFRKKLVSGIVNGIKAYVEGTPIQ